MFAILYLGGIMYGVYIIASYIYELKIFVLHLGKGKNLEVISAFYDIGAFLAILYFLMLAVVIYKEMIEND